MRREETVNLSHVHAGQRKCEVGRRAAGFRTAARTPRRFRGADDNDDSCKGLGFNRCSLVGLIGSSRRVACDLIIIPSSITSFNLGVVQLHGACYTSREYQCLMYYSSYAHTFADEDRDAPSVVLWPLSSDAQFEWMGPRSEFAARAWASEVGADAGL